MASATSSWEPSSLETARAAVHRHPTVAFGRVDRDLQRPRLAAACQLHIHELEARLIDDRFDQRSQFLRDFPIHAHRFHKQKKRTYSPLSTTHLLGRTDRPIARLLGPITQSDAQSSNTDNSNARLQLRTALGRGQHDPLLLA